MEKGEDGKFIRLSLYEVFVFLPVPLPAEQLCLPKYLRNLIVTVSNKQSVLTSIKVYIHAATLRIHFRGSNLIELLASVFGVIA